MKKIVLLLLSFFFLESVWCQYYRPALASSVVNMPTCMGDGAICRSYGNAKVLVHHVDLADRHRHHFALQLSDTNVISELVVTLGGQNDVNDTLYEIRDMRVLGDTCYFCGRRKVNWGEPVYDNWGHVLDPGVEYKGVLGWFPISDFRSQSVEVNVYHADFAQDMSRLTVRRKEPGLWPWYDLKVTAIGIDAQGRQCVTEMITPSSLPLMCGGWGITNYVLVGSNDELFCDVLDTETGTLLLAVDTSDADGIDRHRKLVLHNIYREGLSVGNFDGRSGIVHVMLNSEGDFLSGSVIENVVAEKANYNWEGAGPSGDSFVRIGTVLATGRVTECSQPLGTAERL